MCYSFSDKEVTGLKCRKAQNYYFSYDQYEMYKIKHIAGRNQGFVDTVNLGQP